MASSPWWSPAYRFRRKLRITANGGRVIPNPFFAKLPVSLATLALRGDRNDVRFIRWTGSGFVELARYVIDDNTCFFALDINVNAGFYNEDVYVYYGNPNATAPANDRRYVFVPRLDGQTLSLYYFDGSGEDYADGQLTPETTLANAGAVTFPDELFHKVARSNGSGSSILWKNPGSSSTMWGSGAHPLRMFEFWINPDDYSDEQVVFNFWRVGAPADWQKVNLMQQGKTSLRLEWVNPSNGAVGVSFNNILTVGIARHIGVLFYPAQGGSPDRVAVWRDGVLFTVVNTPNGAYPKGSASNTFPAVFARFNGTTMQNFYKGALYGLKLGRNNGEEYWNGGLNFEHGKRNLLPQIDILGQEFLGGHSGIV